ncbi:MAG: hypothetical protein ACLP9S_13870 [Syntrophales bacterium]
MECIDWPSWIQAIATIVICFITGFYAYYAKKQSKKMEETAEATQISADAAKRAADALPVTERAYVFVTIDTQKIELVYDRDRGHEGLFDFGASIRIWNHGRTPAIINKIRGVISLEKATIPEIEEIEIPTGIVLGNDKWRPIPVSRRINDNELKNIAALNTPTYCCGRVEYKDIFNGDHVTGFCWEYSPHDSHPLEDWVISAKYNELNYYT